MGSSRSTYLKNLAKLARGKSLLDPLVVTYYATTKCNLNCVYCEDFGARLNNSMHLPSFEEVQKILSVIRTATDNLVITGGEPLTHPRIENIIEYARKSLHFRKITMLTNGLVLNHHQSVLQNLDKLVISIDSLDPELWHKMIGTAREQAEAILNNVVRFSSLQQEYNFKMVINCVLTPQNLGQAWDILKFCQDHNLLVSFSPQALHNWPVYDLLVSTEFKSLVRDLVIAKRDGAPILGSRAYLETLSDFSPYKCYPTTAPRVMPDGELIYPCRPVEKENDSFGGGIKLTNVESWQEAVAYLEKEYGPPPISCSSCYQQCYIEPSLMQAQPIDYFSELLKYPPSRAGALATHTPG